MFTPRSQLCHALATQKAPCCWTIALKSACHWARPELNALSRCLSRRGAQVALVYSDSPSLFLLGAWRKGGDSSLEGPGQTWWEESPGGRLRCWGVGGHRGPCVQRNEAEVGCGAAGLVMKVENFHQEGTLEAMWSRAARYPSPH